MKTPIKMNKKNSLFYELCIDDACIYEFRVPAPLAKAIEESAKGAYIRGWQDCLSKKQRGLRDDLKAIGKCHRLTNGPKIYERHDLIIEVRGGCSIPGIELYYMLEELFREKGFKDIGLEGLTEKERHGWDGFVSEESVKIIFNMDNNE